MLLSDLHDVNVQIERNILSENTGTSSRVRRYRPIPLTEPHVRASYTAHVLIITDNNSNKLIKYLRH